MTDSGWLIFGIAGCRPRRAPGGYLLPVGHRQGRGASRDPGPSHLPEVFRRDWVMNANDSLGAERRGPADRLPRMIGCEDCQRSMRTKVVAGLRPRPAEAGQGDPGDAGLARAREPRLHRRGGVRAVVSTRSATPPGSPPPARCRNDWDGRSNPTSSAGAGIFEEFVRYASLDGVNLWEVPFDAKHPFTTPRRLSTSPEVVTAMTEAITAVTDRFDLTATYGDMHRSGDNSTAGWPVGGGLGNLSGDANATQSQTGVGARPDHLRVVVHPGDRVRREEGHLGPDDPHHSQYADPASPWSDDQTQLFSQQQWCASRGRRRRSPTSWWTPSVPRRG